MSSPQEIYRQIEETCYAYGERQMLRMLNHSDLTNEEMREIRGRAMAARDIAKQLRNNLGYSPEE
jgi:hypothetical protein